MPLKVRWIVPVMDVSEGEVAPMNEGEWVASVVSRLNQEAWIAGRGLKAEQGKKVPYAQETRSYSQGAPAETSENEFETDILVSDIGNEQTWTPRVIIEAKVASITTHDAITYSQKAAMHKSVHPYLRYGVMLGKRRHYPLPGRLYRHGAHFDFMLSWVNLEPTKAEWDAFVKLVGQEVAASRDLEEMLYDSHKRDRQHFTLLHKKLIVVDVNEKKTTTKRPGSGRP